MSLQDPKQMTFQEIKEYERKHNIPERINEPPKKVVREITFEVTEKTDNLLLHTLSNEQLGFIARRIALEMERRKLIC